MVTCGYGRSGLKLYTPRRCLFSSLLATWMVRVDILERTQFLSFYLQIAVPYTDPKIKMNFQC